VDGLVFVSAGSSQAAIEMLSTQKMPVVIVDREISGLAMDSVLTDNQQGGYQATRYLLTLGHRRIACITGPSQLTPSAERVTGYRNALKEAGIAVDDTLILAGDFQSQSGYEAMRELLSLSPPPTAVFVCNDLMAIGAMRAVRERGLQIGPDIAITGFDDIPLVQHTIPPLTTVHQPIYQIGKRVTQMLIDLLQGNPLVERQVLLEPSVKVRASSLRRAP